VRQRWSEVLVEAARALQRSDDNLSPALGAVADCVISQVADGCAILIEDGSGPGLRPTIIQHRDDESRVQVRAIISELAMTLDDPRLSRLLQSAMPVQIVEPQHCQLALHESTLANDYAKRVGLSGLLVAVLRARDRPHGLLAIWRDGEGDRFTDADREMAAVLASQMALAICAMRHPREESERERDTASVLLDNLLTTAPVGITFYDTSLRIERANAYFAAHSSIQPEDAIGRKIDDLLPTLTPTISSQLQQVIDTGEPLLDIEMSGTTPDNPDATRYWRTSHYPVHLPDGALLGVSGITLDITNQKAMDGELRESLKRAEELAAAEKEARKAAEQAAAIRDDFLSIASHELKTPLTTIKATAQLLDRRLRQPNVDVERVRRHTTLLQREINRLATLVDDLLNATHIQRGRLTLRPERVDLVDLTRQALARFEYATERTERHNVRFIAPEHLSAWLDPGRIDQVLTNLISNALKYSPDGGEVRVVVQKAGEYVEITVVDHGMGINREEQGKLFQPFARSAMIRQTIGGSGLGLYIASRIVAQHGGSITVESQPDIGSIFRVHLPLVAASAEA
jgi:signal transduction histidine kinase